MPLHYYNRHSGKIEDEKVYGDQLIQLLYGTSIGRILSPVLAYGPLSGLYGKWQEGPYSVSKIKSFVNDYEIDLDDFLPEEGGTLDKPYSSFNQFFIRRFKPGRRQFVDEAGSMPAPCEARYYGIPSGEVPRHFPIKGKYLDPASLLEKEEWKDTFKGGPILIARLCPVDYHRFHFPDTGKILAQYPVSGGLHSVNPLALKVRPDIFIANERRVAILETVNFGKLAYIEVGALCVGKIVHSFNGVDFKRGEEKGYFLFGGSTVIILGQKDQWVPSVDITENTKKNLETYVHLGHPVARRSDLV